MKEFQLHYIWHNRLFNPFKLYTTTHEKIEVIFPGTPNKESGPDFTNALIKINGILWSGNVEIHVKSSDWKRHKHDSDKNYENVILHVVLQNDIEIETLKGRKVYTIELKKGVFTSTSTEISDLKNANFNLTCDNLIQKTNKKDYSEWILQCGEQRMQRKIENFKSYQHSGYVKFTENIIYSLGKYLVGKANEIPFQFLLENIPWKIFIRKENCFITTLAILIYKSGLQNSIPSVFKEIIEDKYLSVSKIYGSKSIANLNWKHGGIRPANQPEIRIIQMAFLIFHSKKSLNTLTQSISFSEWQDQLKRTQNELLNDNSLPIIKEINKYLIPGKSTLLTIYLNVLYPLNNSTKNSTKENIELKNLPVEKNYIIQKFMKSGIRINNAQESQGLIELHENYCRKHKCLDCEIGKKILNKQTSPHQ
jgi:Protein of unknown function (DUF2851)